MAGLYHVALRFPGLAHADVVRADQRGALARELGDHQLCFGRLLGEGGQLLAPMDGAVLGADQRRPRRPTLGQGEQPRQHHRAVAALRHHRRVADAMEPHRVARRRGGDRDACEGRRVGGQDAAQPVHIPARDEPRGDAPCRLERRGGLLGRRPPLARSGAVASASPAAAAPGWRRGRAVGGASVVWRIAFL